MNYFRLLLCLYLVPSTAEEVSGVAAAGVDYSSVGGKVLMGSYLVQGSAFCLAPEQSLAAYGSKANNELSISLMETFGTYSKCKHSQ